MHSPRVTTSVEWVANVTRLSRHPGPRPPSRGRPRPARGCGTVHRHADRAGACSTPVGSPSPMSHPPSPTPIAPAAMRPGVVGRDDPGREQRDVRERATKLRQVARPDAQAGKSFTALAPACQAASTSVGVSAPGRQGTPALDAPFDDGLVDVRHDDEGRALMRGLPSGIHAQHCTGPDETPGRTTPPGRRRDRRSSAPPGAR